MNTVAYRNVYGTKETNGLVNGNEYHQQARIPMEWYIVGLKVTRLRLLSDPGFPVWDVSYCHGVMPDGTLVDVVLPFSQLPKQNLRGAIIEHARADGVYAKAIGILDCISTLN